MLLKSVGSGSPECGRLDSHRLRLLEFLKASPHKEPARAVLSLRDVLKTVGVFLRNPQRGNYLQMFMSDGTDVFPHSQLPDIVISRACLTDPAQVPVVSPDLCDEYRKWFPPKLVQAQAGGTPCLAMKEDRAGLGGMQNMLEAADVNQAAPAASGGGPGPSALEVEAVDASRTSLQPAALSRKKQPSGGSAAADHSAKEL